MTTAEFRSNKALCEQWGDMLQKHELLRLVLFDVMENSHPARFAVMGDGNGDVSPTRAAIELGTTRGFSMYADRLKLLAKPATKKEQELPEPTYQPPEE